MWEIQVTTQWPKDHKHYAKKHPNELAAVLNNLDRYQRMLNAAPNAGCVKAGFLHAEPMGVMAIDQKGGGGNLQETRLYTYPDSDKQILHLITIGNKDSQGSDIEYSKEYVTLIREQKAS